MAIAETRDERATMMRGSKIRIYPNQRQAQMLDLWRRRAINLWNLLLSLEQAAYSGENTRSKLGWRSIWAQVMEESHAEAVRVARDGKQRKDGSFSKAPGERKEPPPLDDMMLAKIRRQWQAEIDPETGEPASARLFIWEHELQKIMARLKQVPRTEWIADLPSHAAQAVVKDLIKALQAMLRERKKRVGGEGGRDTGFPKFKKSRYAAGSVYFANTQLFFDFEHNRVKFPNGVGQMCCEIPITIRLDAQSAGWKPKLMGGRAWREGEKWFLSCQWEIRKPPELPKTGRTAGIKIAASILLTTYDDRGQTREFTMPPQDPHLVAQHRRAGQRLALILGGQKKKEAKLKARKLWQQEKAVAAGKTVKPLGRPRVKRSAAFFAAAARLANLEATQRNARDDFLHKLTTNVVHAFDAISVQKMEVAELMKKPSARLKRRAARKLKQDDAAKPRRDLKPVRKLMRHVAMARCRQLLAYKFRDLRGPDAYQEIDTFDVNVTACSSCGTVHAAWKDGRRIVRCNAVLPDGSECGTVLPRNRNAARLTKRELGRRRQKSEAG